MIVRRPRSLVIAGVVASAIAAVALTGPTVANAAPAKAKPAVGQLVIGGATSDVTAYTWEVTADSTFTEGGASIAKPNPSAIRFTKRIDSSSVPTLQKIAAGQAFDSAVFTVTVGKGRDASTMVYELQVLLVTRVAEGASDGEVTEEISFVFKAVKWTFTSAEGDVTTGTWDVVSGATT